MYDILSSSKLAFQILFQKQYQSVKQPSVWPDFEYIISRWQKLQLARKELRMLHANSVDLYHFEHVDELKLVLSIE